MGLGKWNLAKIQRKRTRLALNYQMLERLLQETEVTRWITQNMYSSEYFLKMFTELGFEYYITNCTYEATRNAWEAFLEKEKPQQQGLKNSGCKDKRGYASVRKRGRM